MNATDEIWRWIVGLGAVIPSLALLARLLIPESPRYLLEVEKDSHTAEQNAKSYFTDPFQDPEEDPATVGNEIAGGDTNVPDNSADRNTDQGIMLDDLTNAEGHSQRFDQGQPLSATDNTATMLREGNLDVIERYAEQRGNFLIPGDHGIAGTTLNGTSTISSTGSPNDGSQSVDLTSMIPPVNLIGRSENDMEQLRLPPPHHQNKNEGINIDLLEPAQEAEDNPRTRKATWKEFIHGFHDYLFSPEWINISVIDVDDLPIPDPDAPPSHQKWTDGNWTDLVGTSATWALLDFSFCFLGINSWKVIAKIWDTPPYTIYQYIIQFSWRALISVSVSSMIGGALFIAMAKHRHNLQMFGFLILAVFLIAVGGTFVTLLGGRYFAAIIVLYFFTQLFFDFGKHQGD